MRIAIASEHAGFDLKEELVVYLRAKNVETEDLGAQSGEPIDYPYIAQRLGTMVVNGEYNRGILICGTGIGMSIAVGKVRGVRAALCTDPFMASMSRRHNDANVLCLGSWITGLRLTYAIVDAYLESEFEAGRHQRRIDQIAEIENK
jgi:ribose 5-phosphate isomerase B